MSNRIALMYSTKSGDIPDATALMTGELVVNIVDGRIYTKDTGSNIILLAGGSPQISSSYALTASYALNAASGGGLTNTGSFTGSFTGSVLGNAATATTASFVSASYTSQTSISSSYAITSSYSIASATASLLLGSVVSASYALTASYALNAAGTSSIGKHTIFIPAAAMFPRLLSGAVSIAQIQLGNSGTGSNHISMDFTGSTIQYAQFYVGFPRSWDKASVTSRFIWSHVSSSVNFNVVWGIHALTVFNSGSMTGSFGTGTEITSSGGIQDYMYMTSETPNITMGSPDNNSMVIFEMYRSASKGTTADNLAVNARLLGIELLYTTNAAVDN